MAFPIAPSEDGGARLNVLLSSITLVYNGSTDVLQPQLPDTLPVSTTLDSGTPLQNIPTSIYNQVASFLKVTYDQDGDPIIDCGVADLDGGLAYGFDGPHGSVEIGVPFAALTIPNGNDCVLGLFPTPDGDIPTLGDTFMRSAYILYNYDANTISLAQAEYDNSCTDCAVPLQ